MSYRSLGYASLARSGRPTVGISHPLVESKDSDSEAPGIELNGGSSTTPDNPSSLDYPKEKVPDRIAITSRRKIVFVDLADVVAVEARCNYVVLRTLSGAHALRQPISAIAEDIERYGFVRIHRSTIVNGRFVEEIRTSASGKMFVHLKGLGSGYDVSRKYRSALRLFASRWTYGATV
ncbi:MAG TPA: LytTR family DNA-binding domain-containing protein [Candidatus Acidoferrum sp.]|nr:LytTR family DNA-binding domain-containing protein [Candidatus Acidoferrum sp.]